MTVGSPAEVRDQPSRTQREPRLPIVAAEWAAHAGSARALVTDEVEAVPLWSGRRLRGRQTQRAQGTNQQSSVQKAGHKPGCRIARAANASPWRCHGWSQYPKRRALDHLGSTLRAQKAIRSTYLVIDARGLTEVLRETLRERCRTERTRAGFEVCQEHLSANDAPSESNANGGRRVFPLCCKNSPRYYHSFSIE